MPLLRAPKGLERRRALSPVNLRPLTPKAHSQQKRRHAVRLRLPKANLWSASSLGQREYKARSRGRHDQSRQPGARTPKDRSQKGARRQNRMHQRRPRRETPNAVAKRGDAKEAGSRSRPSAESPRQDAAGSRQLTPQEQKAHAEARAKSEADAGSRHSDGSARAELVKEGYVPDNVFMDWVPRAIPAEGWKIHVTADAVSAGKVADLLLPQLRDMKIAHKVVTTPERLASMANGRQAGKFITIYPMDVAQLKMLTDFLNRELSGKGFSGPAIKGDRPIGPSGQVFVRYGGLTKPTITYPSGVEGPETRGLVYKPDWIVDRWADESHGVRPSGGSGRGDERSDASNDVDSPFAPLSGAVSELLVFAQPN